MKKTHPIPDIVRLASLALLVHAAGAVAAPASSPEVGSYLNGSVGLEERQAMQAERAEYNLQLRFAKAKTGEYLSGVNVTIESQAKMQTAWHLKDAGPLLYVRLQPGSYRICAESDGSKQVLMVKVGRHAREHMMYWP